MLSSTTIQSVRDLDVFEVISKYVSLKKNGNIYKGCCPFHNEKSPSFTVNPQKNIYKCFGCGVGGDGIRFVMEHEKMEFISAVERIAKDHSIHIEHEKQTEEQIEQEKVKKTLYDATEFANKYFKASLADNTDAQKYLDNRSIFQEDILKWNIGYAADSNFLSKHAMDTGALELYKNAGLINSSSRNSSHFDFYRNRIIVPIQDNQNRIITFSGRAIDGVEPKYINGYETAIFNKSDILFGVHNYKRPFPKCHYSVLVEGYFDVISLHKIGCTNALASNGTAVTKQQAKLLKRLSDTIIIWKDNDKAGLDSCLRSINILLEEGLKVRVYESWTGKDADDFAKDWYHNHPHLSIAVQLYNSSMDGVEFKAIHLMKHAENPAQISDAKTAIGEMLHKIPNATLRDEYARHLSKTLKIKEAEIKSVLKFIDETEKKKAEERKSKDIKMMDENLPEWFDLEHRKHFSKFQFTSLICNGDTGYYFPDNSWAPIQQTNFVIQPLYMIKSFQNPRRMCEVFGFNRLDDKMLSEVIDFDEKQLLKREQFESRLAVQSPFITFEGYSNTNHKRLINKLLFQFKDCYELNTLGYQPEQFWAFANVCFEFPTKEHPNGIEREYNDFGVVQIGENNFLSEAKNKRVNEMRLDNNNPYENDLFFIYKKSEIDFSAWAKLIDKVYTSEKAWMAVSFAVATVFRDVVLNFTKIPHLHCYGEKGSGKSVFAESIFHLFFSGKDAEGKLYKPYNLTGGGTPYSFHNRMERFRSCPQVLNEYDDTNILPEFFDAIKAAFDGEGRERGMGVKGKTETMKRNSTLILVGQKIGNRDDNSVLTRCVTVEFLKKDFTDEELGWMQDLENIEIKGLSSIIIEILSHRTHFKERFAQLFLQTVTELQKKVAEIYAKVETRIIKSLAALQLSYLVMAEVVAFPLNAAQLKQHVFNKAVEMHAHLQSTDGLSEFWKVVEFLLDRNEIEEDWDFKIRSVTNVKLRRTIDGKNVDEVVSFNGEKKLLYIRLSQLHQFYCLHINRTSKGEKPLSEKTIQTYMSSQSYYLGLCPGTGFKSAIKNKSKDSTSCYVLDYDKLGVHLETSSFQDDRTEETINGVIHKIHDTDGDMQKVVVKSIITIKAEPIDKSMEQYTNCYLPKEKAAEFKKDDSVMVTGMVSVNNHGYRNMDVINILSSDSSLFDLF